MSKCLEHLGFYRDNIECEKKKASNEFQSDSNESELISEFTLYPELILNIKSKQYVQSDSEANFSGTYYPSNDKQTKEEITSSFTKVEKREKNGFRKKINKKKKNVIKPTIKNRSTMSSQLSRRTNHFCRNKTTIEFINAWQTTICHDFENIPVNPRTKKLILKFDLDIKYIFNKSIQFKMCGSMVRIFDFGLPTDPYYYHATFFPLNPSFNYSLEYIKHKKVISITYYKSKKTYKIKLQELTYNKTFALDRQKTELKFVQTLKSFNNPKASILADSINITINDLKEAYNFSRTNLKENNIFRKSNIKILRAKTQEYIENSPYVCIKYDNQPDLHFAPFISEIYTNDKFNQLAKYEPSLQDGFGGLQIFNLMKTKDWTSTFYKFFMRRTLKKFQTYEEFKENADYFQFPQEFHFIDTLGARISLNNKTECFIERYFKDYRMVEKQYLVL